MGLLLTVGDVREKIQCQEQNESEHTGECEFHTLSNLDWTTDDTTSVQVPIIWRGDEVFASVRCCAKSREVMQRF
jgi:hypothetical protein